MAKGFAKLEVVAGRKGTTEIQERAEALCFFKVRDGALSLSFRGIIGELSTEFGTTVAGDPAADLITVQGQHGKVPFAFLRGGFFVFGGLGKGLVLG